MKADSLDRWLAKLHAGELGDEAPHEADGERLLKGEHFIDFRFDAEIRRQMWPRLCARCGREYRPDLMRIHPNTRHCAECVSQRARKPRGCKALRAVAPRHHRRAEPVNRVTRREAAELK